MGRNVTISILNETGHDLTDLIEEKIDHGKFNQDPPNSIQNSQMGVFQPGNRTGSKIGPKGTISYRMTPNVRVYITWDHPFSAATSTYTCYSVPAGMIRSTLLPNDPSGHNQSISFTIESN